MTTTENLTSDLMRVDIEQIKVKQNFRKEFKIDALKQSMEQRGLIQPIVVTPDLILVAGERRLRAAKALGWTEIDCIVRQYNDGIERMADGVFENVKRAELSPSETMRALAWLKNTWERKRKIKTSEGSSNRKLYKDSESCPTFAEKASKELGMGKKTLERKVRIGKSLSPKMAKAIDKKEITEKQAEQLVRIPDENVQESLLDQVVGTSLIKTKEIVDKAENKIKRKPRKRPKNQVQGKSVETWLRGLIRNIDQLSTNIDYAIDNKVWEKAKRNRDPFLDKLFEFQLWSTKFNAEIKKIKRR